MAETPDLGCPIPHQCFANAWSWQLVGDGISSWIPDTTTGHLDWAVGSWPGTIRHCRQLQWASRQLWWSVTLPRSFKWVAGNHPLKRTPAASQKLEQEQTQDPTTGTVIQHRDVSNDILYTRQDAFSGEQRKGGERKQERLLKSNVIGHC